MTAAEVVQLDAARVRAQLGRVRESLRVARDVLVELWELGKDGSVPRAWVTLGLESWEELCARELPELGELFSLAQRRELAVELRGTGMSLRAAAAGADVSPNAVRKWAAAAGVEPEKATGRDGRERAARRPQLAAVAPAPAVPTVHRLVSVVADAGRPLDVREVCALAKLPREEVSPALCRLAAAGRLVYLAPERRGQFGRYTV